MRHKTLLLLLLLVLVGGGAYVWFSLNPGDNVNLQATADLATINSRISAARRADLPISLSGNEIKALAIQAIKRADLDDNIQGIDVQLGQDSVAVQMAVAVGPKVMEVSLEAEPVLADGLLRIDLSNTKVGAVPIPVGQLLQRFADRLPSGIAVADGGLTFDLSQTAFKQWSMEEIAVEDGTLQLQPK